MIKSENGVCMISGSGALLLAELTTIVSSMKEAMGDLAEVAIPMAVDIGLNGLPKGKHVEDDDDDEDEDDEATPEGMVS